MQFTCEKSALSLAFSVAGRTAAQKSALTALEGILCRAGNDELRFTGFNMETAITYAVEAEVGEEGSCILPARLFGDIVRRLPEGPVTVNVDDQFKVSIKGGYAAFQISAQSSEDYPELPDVGEGRGVQIPQGAMKELINGTIFAVSDNQSRPVHTGVKFEVEPDALDDFMKNGPWDALNVTIPYKRDVIPYCAELSEAARQIGSVNTLVRRPDGTICRAASLSSAQ